MRLGAGKTGTVTSRGALAGLVLVLVALLLPAASQAQDSRKGRIEVRSAYTVREDNVYFLIARIDYRLSREAQEALANGVALNIELQINLTRTRRLMWDAGIASLRQRYQLSFHALTERYVVLNLNSGESASYQELGTALAALGTVDRLPLIDAALLDEDDRYEIAMRSVLDIKELPASVRLLSLVWGNWRMASEWYSWRLRP
jgi:hypothetical protein